MKYIYFVRPLCDTYTAYTVITITIIFLYTELYSTNKIQLQQRENLLTIMFSFDTFNTTIETIYCKYH